MVAITRQEYEALCNEIWHHNYLYFQEGRPEISDRAFDELCAKLQAIEQAHPEWVSPTSPTRVVGEKPLEGFAEVVHRVPMLSLDKAFTQKEVADFQARVQKLLEVSQVDYCVELKMDGVAIAVFYEQGHYTRAVTRGDGRVGSDVTANVKTLKGLPLRLQKEAPDFLEVRGEVFLPKEGFIAMNADRKEQELELWANPRNAAAGSLKLLDPREVAARKELDIVFYACVTHHKMVPSSQYQMHSFLEHMGLPTARTTLQRYAQKKGASHLATIAPVLSVSTLAQIQAFTDQIAACRQELVFDIDGIVIKVDDLAAFDALGTTGKHPRGAIAYKFSAERGWTSIRSITVQVGRTGVMTPVAELEPVWLAGSRISRATLHNFEELERKDIRIGDTVAIEKGGDVIPKVIDVDREARPHDSQPYIMPAHCPCCHTPLIKDPQEVAWRCPNSAGCFDQIVRRLMHFASKEGLDIENLGEKVMHKLVAKGFVKKPSDIFHLSASMLAELEGFKEKSIYNLLASIEKAKNTTLARLLLALGIRYIGTQAATLLAQEVHHDVERLLQFSYDELMHIPGIGDKMAKELVKHFADPENIQELQRLLQYVKLSLEATCRSDHLFSNKTLVLSGTLSIPRSEAVLKIQQVGGRVGETISKKTDFLVVGENPGSKLAKAQKLGIAILNEAEFLHQLEA
jgi:DNA ligase (NAD+)